MYNSDGYVLIDLTGVDIAKTNQHVTGIYNRVLTVIDINKLALVINAGDLTPMAAVVHKKLNYYVINTPLYIFTINSNDIIMIEEAGEATVDVAIVPTLTEGVKVADFAVGSVEGSIYAPEQQSEINDNVTASNTTYSSDKINNLLSGKANTADLATVATTGSYTDLSNKPTIPTKVSELQNDSGYITDSVLSDYQPKTDNTLDTTAKTITGAINELNNDKLDASKFEVIRVELQSPNLNESMYFFRQGNICILECQTILAQGVTIPIGGTLDLYTIQNQNNYPDTLKASSLFISGGLVGMVRFDNETGKITLYNQSGSLIGANSAINFSLAYMAKIN